MQALLNPQRHRRPVAGQSHTHLWLALPCVSSYAIWLATEACVTQGRNPCPFECYLFILRWIENALILCFPSASVRYMAVPDTQALSQRGYVGVISNISFLIGFRVMSTDVIFLYYLIMAKASSVIEVEICMALYGEEACVSLMVAPKCWWLKIKECFYIWFCGVNILAW